MLNNGCAQIGNTGKSVARSYSCALDGLIPAKATISSGRGVRSPGQKGYDDAMAFLKAKEGGKTIVDIYVEKQLAWGKARSEWDNAKNEAQGKHGSPEFSPACAISIGRR